MLRSNRTSLFNLVCAAVLAVLVVASVQLAQAQLVVTTIGGGGNTNADFLQIVDPITGQTGSSVSVTLAGFTVQRGLGLTVQPGTGTLFAILRVTDGVTTTRHLVSIIDPDTGVATDEGDFGDNFSDIAFAPDGTLYGVTGEGATAPEALFTLDFSGPGVVRTQVATLGNGDNGESIAVDPNTGLIYHASGLGARNDSVNGQILETIDPANGFAVANIPYNTSTHDAGEVGGMAYWGAGLFLAHNHLGDLVAISTTGNVRVIRNLNHTPGGIVVTGTPPSCTPLQALYGSAYQHPEGPAALYSINPANGAASMIGPIGFERVGAMTYLLDGTANPALFATGERMDGTNTVVLITINPCTGAGTEVGPTGLAVGAPVGDIAQSPDDGTLFGFVFKNGDLYSFDTTNGAATLVGTSGLPFNGGHGLAFRTDFGVPTTLYHSNGGELDTLNVTNGAGTFSVALSFPVNLAGARLNAMEVNPASNVLFASAVIGFSASETHLVTVNTTTGHAPDLGRTQLGVDAIAFTPLPIDAATTIADDVDPVNVNDGITYTVNVQNPAPSFLSHFITTITFSGAAANITNATAGCVIAAPVVTCDLGAIPANTTSGFGVQVTALATGAIVVDACTTSDTFDSNTANNCDQETTAVGTGADVSVTKVDTVDPVTHPGGVITYNITVTNNDPANNAGGVTVTDTFTGTAVAFNSATPSQGTCNAALPIVCNLGDIPVTGVATVTVVVNTTAAGTVTDTVNVTTVTADPTPANNTAVETTLVNSIDLVVTKTDSPDPTAVGAGNITYTVTVSNAGTLAATNVSLTDNFTFGSGAAANFVSATPSQGTCTPAFPAVPCALGTIIAGANTTVTIVATPTAGGTITNTASATAAETDPTPADNTNIAQTTTVAATQDFIISVSPSSVTILPGQSVVFTVTITPNTFVTSVTVDCSHSIPLASCSGPITLTPVNGTQAATGTMTLTTSGSFAVQHRAPNSLAPVYALWLPLSGFGVLGLVLVNSNRRRLTDRKRTLLVALLSLLILASLIVGCGGDSSDEGTPGGVYTVTFTGTGGNQTHSTTATVTVQGSN